MYDGYLEKSRRYVCHDLPAPCHIICSHRIFDQSAHRLAMQAVVKPVKTESPVKRRKRRGLAAQPDVTVSVEAHVSGGSESEADYYWSD